MTNLVDITHTIDTKVSNGRRLFRDLDTGKTEWEERRAVPRDENAVWPAIEVVEVPVENVAAEEVLPELAFANPALTGATTEYLEAKVATPKKGKK